VVPHTVIVSHEDEIPAPLVNSRGNEDAHRRIFWIGRDVVAPVWIRSTPSGRHECVDSKYTKWQTRVCGFEVHKVADTSVWIRSTQSG
jgi:hypothetical protein